MLNFLAAVMTQIMVCHKGRFLQVPPIIQPDSDKPYPVSAQFVLFNYALAIFSNSSNFRLAPPTRPPSILGMAKSSAALEALTLPP